MASSVAISASIKTQDFSMMSKVRYFQVHCTAVLICSNDVYSLESYRLSWEDEEERTEKALIVVKAFR